MRNSLRYRLCKKYKWFDWIDDNIFWYIWDKPLTWYKTVRCWWYLDAKNPYHWKLVSYCLFHNRPWADCYDFEVLKLQIQKQLYYFENEVRMISEQHKSEAIRYMKLAINLIDIYNENIDLWDYDYKNPDKPSHDDKYICKVNVNNKNYERFIPLGYDYSNPPKMVKCDKYLLSEPHELYKLKAKRLLMKILDRKSDLWWD